MLLPLLWTTLLQLQQMLSLRLTPTLQQLLEGQGVADLNLVSFRYFM